MDGGIGPAFDGGTGRLAILTSAQPAGSAQTGTVLATFTLPSDVWAAAVAGVAALNAVGAAIAGTGGTAAGFCFYRSTDTAIGSAPGATDRRLAGTVGTSGADMTIGTTAITVNDTVTIAGLNYAAPA